MWSIEFDWTIEFTQQPYLIECELGGSANNACALKLHLEMLESTMFELEAWIWSISSSQKIISPPRVQNSQLDSFNFDFIWSVNHLNT